MRNPLIIDGEDTVMRMMAFFLIWMPSGQCWSVQALPCAAGSAFSQRAWLRQAPGWGLRLLQIQMATIFLSTGLLKLGGDEWIDGTALYYVSRLDDFFGRFPVPAWPFDTPWTRRPDDLGRGAGRAGRARLHLVRETRRLCLLATVLFHLANEWTMHLFLFHWIMLVGWLSFLTTEDLAWFSSRIRQNSNRAADNP